MVRISVSSSLIDGYDEPEILRSSITPICPMSADAGHSVRGRLPSEPPGLRGASPCRAARGDPHARRPQRHARGNGCDEDRTGGAGRGGSADPAHARLQGQEPLADPGRPRVRRRPRRRSHAGGGGRPRMGDAASRTPAQAGQPRGPRRRDPRRPHDGRPACGGRRVSRTRRTDCRRRRPALLAYQSQGAPTSTSPG
jgi:hypothetical protein